MKYWNWKTLLGSSLLLLSFLFYGLHYLLFRDLHHIALYLVGDLAFLFFEVLFVTLVIHGVLEKREMLARQEKINMVIGAFFSEVGTRILEMLARKDKGLKDWQMETSRQSESRAEEYKSITKFIEAHDHHATFGAQEWDELKEFLIDKRQFMLRLLENPNLHEHECFTDLLWAVFHLTEELGFRKSLEGLPESDYKHLAGDVTRVYSQLSRQWLAYLEHLRESYPYLFSLAVRTNPFNPSASVVVRE